VQRYLVTEIQGYAIRKATIWCWRRVFFAKDRSISRQRVGGACDQADQPAGGGARAARAKRRGDSPAKSPAANSVLTVVRRCRRIQPRDLAIRFGLALRGEPDLRVSSVATLSHARSGS